MRRSLSLLLSSLRSAEHFRHCPGECFKRTTIVVLFLLTMVNLLLIKHFVCYNDKYRQLAFSEFTYKEKCLMKKNLKNLVAAVSAVALCSVGMLGVITANADSAKLIDKTAIVDLKPLPDLPRPTFPRPTAPTRPTRPTFPRPTVPTRPTRPTRFTIPTYIRPTYKPIYETMDVSDIFISDVIKDALLTK